MIYGYIGTLRVKRNNVGDFFFVLIKYFLIFNNNGKTPE